MYIKRSVSEWDFTGEKFPTPQDGFAVVCRGACGRYCEGMWGGKAAMQEQGISDADLMTHEAAYAAITAKWRRLP